MENIKIFDTYQEQLENLKYLNKDNDLVILLNRQTKDINFNYDGAHERIYKYADKNKKDLTKYLELELNYINKDYYIIPKEAEYINVYNSTTNKLLESISINKNKKPVKDPIYKIGLISDVHYNDTDKNDMDPDTLGNTDGSEYSEDLKNALNLFTQENVSFVSCSGDISTDRIEHLNNFKYCIDKYAPDLSIFTCSGNHDTVLKYRYHDLWKSISSINRNNDYEIVYFQDYEEYYDENTNTQKTDENGFGTSFYIKKYYKNTFDVFIYLNVEYGWGDPNNYDTHNTRLLEQNELLLHSDIDTSNDLHLYHPKTLQCLNEVLEEFKDHRCFIFTHLMLKDKAGNYHQLENYMTNEDDYYAYAEYYNHADVLRGDQGEYIQQLMEKYPNNLWFCGHSHYKWIWEKLDHNINITKTGKSYNVHLPSLSRPLPYGIRWYQTALQDSEAAIMEVYDNYVIIKGIIMKEQKDLDYSNIENYPDNDLEYINSEMFRYSENNPYVNITDLENNIIQIDVKIYETNNTDDNNIYLNNGQISSSNYSNYIPVLRFDNLKIWYDDLLIDLDENDPNYENSKNIRINNFTNTILDEHKIGFRDNTTDPNEYDYYFISNHIYTLYSEGLVFKISSLSQYKDLSFHIQFSCKLGFIHEEYINKYLPIAQFKLNTNQ